MSEIHYVERVPRRSDFCGCPPCGLCYEPVLTDDQKAPTFQEVMTQIYGEGPMPQTEQEYEWAHAAAHQCRQELNEQRPDGGYFAAEDRARMTQMQIDDLLKRAKNASEAPKPLNRVNLDDMPVESVEATARKVPEQATVPAPMLDYANQIAQQQQAYQEAMNQQMNALQANKRGEFQYQPFAVWAGGAGSGGGSG